MSFSRYQNDTPIKRGTILKTATAVDNIRKRMKAGAIPHKVVTLKAGQRLDHVAASEFGDGRLWWVTAACSNIGWALQAPPGTVIKVPMSLADIQGVL